MSLDDKKTVLRMIPYGLYVLTAATREGETAAATVNWVTQASFTPPLVALAVKADSHIFEVIRQAGAFALNVLGKEQSPLAYKFFKPAVREGNTIGGVACHEGITGALILESTPAFVECRVVGLIEKGDHSVLLGEVVEAGLHQAIAGRPDEATLWLKDLGEKIFYGG